mmetsp:Transcript_29424/g.73946  ORF Transcript_29424/g.73946 Transcript_29424/m.73946 type:complete len:202 (-) Transcript_29424:163-768(-)
MACLTPDPREARTSPLQPAHPSAPAAPRGAFNPIQSATSHVQGHAAGPGGAQPRAALCNQWQIQQFKFCGAREGIAPQELFFGNRWCVPRSGPVVGTSTRTIPAPVCMRDGGMGAIHCAAVALSASRPAGLLTSSQLAACMRALASLVMAMLTISGSQYAKHRRKKPGVQKWREPPGGRSRRNRGLAGPRAASIGGWQSRV